MTREASGEALGTVSGRAWWAGSSDPVAAKYARERREQTRRRQLVALRDRRRRRPARDPRVVKLLERVSWQELDRMEARGIPMSRIEVAASLGLSFEAVRQIETRALAKVRALLGIPQPEPTGALERFVLERLFLPPAERSGSYR